MADFIHVLISRIPGLVIKERLLIAELFTDAEDIRKLGKDDISRITGRRYRRDSLSMEEVYREAEMISEASDKTGSGILWYWDSGYPPQLREIYDPPAVLYFKGSEPDHLVPHAAVVGTRYPDSDAAGKAFSLASGLAEHGIPVVSGLALGIDSAAHRGALASGGKTTAVLGNGIDSVYPSSNRKLAAGIIDSGGTVMSEYPPGTPPLRYHFPKRNRIISGLCRSVVVVQAPLKSGALITADYALEQGRDLFVHACSLSGSRGSGGLKLAMDGAGIIGSVTDLLKSWNREDSVLSFDILEDPEQWSLSDLLSAELEGQLFQYEGNYFARGGLRYDTPVHNLP